MLIAALLAGHFLLMLGGGPGGQAQPVLESVDRSGNVGIVYARPGVGSGPAGRWSPDGSMLAWTGPDGLWVANADGGGQQRLVRQATACRDVCARLDFAWSPDGRALLVGGAGPQTSSLLLVSVGGGSVEVAPTLRFAAYSALGWTPDGRSVVYTRLFGDPGRAGCCTLDVRVTAVGSGVTRVAYRFPDWHDAGSAPALSPDGRSIAFVHATPSGEAIRVVTLRTGAVRDLRGLRPAGSPAWSPNSRRLAYVSLGRPRFHVETIAARGGPTETIGRGVAVSWARDGELLVVRGGSSDELWVCRRGQPERLLFRSPDQLSVVGVDAY